MLKKILAFAAITFIACLGAFADKVESGFFDAAIKTSADTKKPLLFLLTGSSWCPPCQQFEKSVLASEEWKAFEKENVTFLIYDIVGDKILHLTLNGKSIKGEGKELAAQADEFGLFAQTHNLQYVPSLMTYDHQTKKWRHIKSDYTPAGFIKILKTEWGKK